MCAAEDAERIVAQMREHPLGKDTSVIAEVQSIDESYVTMTTALVE